MKYIVFKCVNYANLFNFFKFSAHSSIVLTHHKFSLFSCLWDSCFIWKHRYLDPDLACPKWGGSPLTSPQYWASVSSEDWVCWLWLSKSKTRKGNRALVEFCCFTVIMKLLKIGNLLNRKFYFVPSSFAIYWYQWFFLYMLLFVNGYFLKWPPSLWYSTVVSDSSSAPLLPTCTSGVRGKGMERWLVEHW